MADQVVNLGVTTCTMGSAPSALMVLPANMVLGVYVPAANIMDYKPAVNILPFVMCKSMSNPAVSAATAANKGVLTPMPCVPATTSPWSPGSSKVLIANQPALNNSSKCMCSLGGSISITFAGQTQMVQIP